MRRRSRVVSLPLAVLALVATYGAEAQAGLPSGANPVSVSSGAVTSGIDAHVHGAASIAGTIKSSSGAPLSAEVTAYHNGNFAGDAFASSGSYLIGGLAAGSYAICVSSFGVSTPSATGYLGRCYKSAAWNGGGIPSGATKVTVTAGQHKTGINLTIAKGGAISGKVTGGGHGVSTAVYAHNRSTGLNFVGFSASNGSYLVKSLPTSAKGYAVCFTSPSGITKGTGFLPRCYKNKSWSSTSTFPKGATPVSVKLGKTHTGVNQGLTKAGAIAGRVTDAKSGKGLRFATVFAFSASGTYLTGTSTNAKGNYVLRGLAASGKDRVCAYPFSPSPSVSYGGRCWKNVTWKGGKLPKGTSPVSVKVGHVHSGISFKLPKSVVKLGSISGTVTEKAGSQPLQDATVWLFRSGIAIAEANSDASGAYSFTNLRKGTYKVCALGDQAFGPTPPATGWAPRCYADVAWDGVSSPSSANAVTLTAGQHRSGVDVALPIGGEITGTVTEFGTTTPAADVDVDVYTAAGTFVTSVLSDFVDGTYSVPSLAAGSYKVCFDGRTAQFGGAGYLPECYNDVAWNGTGRSALRRAPASRAPLLAKPLSAKPLTAKQVSTRLLSRARAAALPRVSSR